MTSSSFCELSLRQDGVEIFSADVIPEEMPRHVPNGPKLPANRSVELTLRRGSTRALLRVLLENEQLLQLRPERRDWTLQLGEKLRDQYGRAELTVESTDPHIPGAWTPVLSVTITIEADPAFQRLHEALVAELEEVDVALTRDIASRTWHQISDRRMSSSALRVESDLQLLFDVYRRIGTALRKIAAQPTRTLRRERRLGRWRAGDIVGTSAVDRMAREGRITRTDRLSLPDKMLLDRPRLATDIEEHRHIRAGIVRLAERAGAISRYCGRAISLLQEEEGRWSEEALRQKIEPKVYGLALIREQAHDLQGRVRRLLEEHPFLAGASLPRTPFGPTPIFLGRPAYREAYRALLDARRHASNRYESERGRVRFRDLATLYEYWLFVRVVGFLSEMYGPPTNNQGFALVDEFYRPELKPGQQFRFRLPHGDHLTATYEPDFPPVVSRARERFRAAMVSAPLRPDVTLELTMPGRPTAILALDAKSGPRFRKADERLLATATYLLWIHDPVTGHQPVRQLFLVHRDMDAPPLANLTGYLEGRVSNPDARVIGAVPAQPRATEALEHVILRFLETYRARKWK